MDNLPVKKRGDAFYFRAPDQAPHGRACILSLGIREIMSPGFIHLGGPTDPAFLFMDFHTPALEDPLGRAEPIERGFMLWQPFAWHHYGNPRAPWLHSWMNAVGSAIEETVAEHGITLNRVMHVDVGAISLKYLHALNDELQEHIVPDDRIIEGLIVLWIREIARAVGGAGRPAHRIIEVRRYIEGHYTEALDLGDLAHRAALSVSQFSAVFKAHFGAPPMEYAQRLRLRHAAHLLGDPALSVGEVATRVGYEDPLYFSRQFRKHLGERPAGVSTIEVAEGVSGEITVDPELGARSGRSSAFRNATIAACSSLDRGRSKFSL